MLEALPVGDAVCDDDSIGLPVVRWRDRSEAFLSSRVPDLKFQLLPVMFDLLRSEINPHCDCGTCVEAAVAEASQQTRLPHCGVAEKEEQNQVVMVG